MRAVVVAGVDVGDAELDRLAQDGHGRVAVGGGPKTCGPGELHRAVAHAPHLAVAEPIGSSLADIRHVKSILCCRLPRLSPLAAQRQRPAASRPGRAVEPGRRRGSPARGSTGKPLFLAGREGTYPSACSALTGLQLLGSSLDRHRGDTTALSAPDIAPLQARAAGASARYVRP